MSDVGRDDKPKGSPLKVCVGNIDFLDLNLEVIIV